MLYSKKGTAAACVASWTRHVSYSTIHNTLTAFKHFSSDLCQPAYLGDIVHSRVCGLIEAVKRNGESHLRITCYGVVYYRAMPR